MIHKKITPICSDRRKNFKFYSIFITSLISRTMAVHTELVLSGRAYYEGDGVGDLGAPRLPRWIYPIIRPRRSRSAAAYSHQTFPCTICRSVCLSVGRSVGLSVCLSSALWKNDRSQPAAVWHHRSDGSTDEAGIGVCQSVHGKGYFWGRIWTAPL